MISAQEVGNLTVSAIDNYNELELGKTEYAQRLLQEFSHHVNNTISMLETILTDAAASGRSSISFGLSVDCDFATTGIIQHAADSYEYVIGTGVKTKNGYHFFSNNSEKASYAIVLLGKIKDELYGSGYAIEEKYRGRPKNIAEMEMVISWNHLGALGKMSQDSHGPIVSMLPFSSGS